MEALMMSEAKKAVSDEAKRKTYDEFVARPSPRPRCAPATSWWTTRRKAKKSRPRPGREDFAKARQGQFQGQRGGWRRSRLFHKDQMVPEFAEAAFKRRRAKSPIR